MGSNTGLQDEKQTTSNMRQIEWKLVWSDGNDETANSGSGIFLSDEDTKGFREYLADCLNKRYLKRIEEMRQAGIILTQKEE